MRCVEDGEAFGVLEVLEVLEVLGLEGSLYADMWGWCDVGRPVSGVAFWLLMRGILPRTPSTASPALRLLLRRNVSILRRHR